MTEPIDYAQPKHRNSTPTQQDALRAVEAAVSEVKQAKENDLPSETRNVSDYAALGSQAITRYFEAAAVHIEQTAQEIMKEAERARDELIAQAEDIRHTAKILTASVDAAANRTKQAALAVIDVRKAFADDVAKERRDAEAARARATG